MVSLARPNHSATAVVPGSTPFFANFIDFEVTSFSVAVAVEKQQRFFVDNLMLSVQLSTRCSSHPQGKKRMTRASSRNVGKLYTEH